MLLTYGTQKLYFSGFFATRWGHRMKFWTITYKYQFLVETTGKAPLKGANFFVLSSLPTSCWNSNTMDGSHVLRMVVWKYKEAGSLRISWNVTPDLDWPPLVFYMRERTSLICTDSCVFRVYIAPTLKQFCIHTGEVLPQKDLWAVSPVSFPTSAA